MAKILYWHRNDLRLQDNPALAWAAQRGAVLPLYILEETADSWSYGGAALWWLHYALDDLASGYRDVGGQLVFRKGDPRQIIPALAQQMGAEAVCWTRRYTPHGMRIDRDVEAVLAQKGIEVKNGNSSYLFEPASLKTKTNNDYKVYTPFSKAAFAVGVNTKLQPMPSKIKFAEAVASDALQDWDLLPTRPDWASGMRKSWAVSAKGAEELLEQFCDEALADYAQGRDIPAQHGTSRLSPYLAFGMLSPKQIWAAAEQQKQSNGQFVYLKELLWREFCAHLLMQFPEFPEKEFTAKFRGFPWREDSAALTAWQKGQTGYPIVDAGMRQLWQTGWMHNRVRMIVASFLIKHLLIDWREGQKWFWDTLVDADLASNSANWQWVAGSGADAAPYFRIFNPILQGQKFDPSGAYVRAYVPELSSLDAKYIHAPWEAPEDVLTKAGVRLGKTYPKPIIDHAAARARALALYKEL